MRLFITVTALLSFYYAFANEKELPIENPFVNFSNIKKILKKDGLEKIVDKKKKDKVESVKAKISIQEQFYNLPDDKDFWPIMVNYWLIKNNAILKWDFHKPDYGLDDYFGVFLKEVSELGLKFNILYVNTSNLTHFAFPYGENEYLFVISVPFIKIMDLSKLQISILLYEDLIRAKNGYFESMIKSSDIKAVRGGNFYKKEFPMANIKSILAQFDSIIYEKGFDFQQQYNVTKQMVSVLTNNKKYWQNYYTLLTKIDDLVKSNLMYKSYPKIYPSPELQLNWINPTKNK